MRRILHGWMLSQVLSARLITRNFLPQNPSISGINGRFSRLPCSSRVARISSRLRTSIHSPAFKFKALCRFKAHCSRWICSSVRNYSHFSGHSI